MNSEKANNFSSQSTNRLINRLTAILFYSSILLFIIGFNFTDRMVGNWYQQFFPDLGGRLIRDVVFKDSLTGYAITTTNTPYILKTINGGDNWSIIFTDNNIQLLNMTFLNNNTGFVGRGYTPNGDAIYKTTNGGVNWLPVNTPTDIIPAGMFALNPDTIWMTDPDGLVGGLYRTINGGTSWIRQVNLGGANPNKIYMFNQYFGFMANLTQLYRTLDGGYNWAPVSGGPWTDIYFIDTVTGWKSGGGMKKTTDGGLNWVTQVLPSGGMIESSVMNSFSNINRDTIWGTGGLIRFANNQLRRFLHRTTNGGDTWYFQLPDTSILGDWAYMNFTDRLKGWVTTYPTGLYTDEIHTITGGDTTFMLGLYQISAEIPKEFKLFQNYPNPFNPISKIIYQLSKNNVHVKISVFDIAGREITVLVNQQQDAGTYEVDFDGTNYSSGIYFYRLTIDNKLTETKKMMLIK